MMRATTIYTAHTRKNHHPKCNEGRSAASYAITNSNNKQHQLNLCPSSLPSAVILLVLLAAKLEVAVGEHELHDVQATKIHCRRAI